MADRVFLGVFGCWEFGKPAAGLKRDFLVLIVLCLLQKSVLSNTWEGRQLANFVLINVAYDRGQSKL